jgi:aspartyl-tRNA(Asn)/glutamyl-tRNA(Gln) amidotransferase subunit C
VIRRHSFRFDHSQPEVPMAITPADVQRVASLARLRCDEAETQLMSEQLTSILDHMDVLRQVDVNGVAPFGAVTQSAAPLRNDCAAPDALHREPGVIAPAWVEPFFVVPRVAALDADAVASDPTPGAAE